MIITETKVKEIKSYVECPELGFTHYGKWGCLKEEQRLLINDLCDSWLYNVSLLDNYVKSWFELKKWLKEEENYKNEETWVNILEVLDKMQELEQVK